MKEFATIRPRKRPRAGFIAIICGALLGATAPAAHAQSGGSYPYEYTAYPGYYRNCYPCRCWRPCGCWRPCPIVQRLPVVERYWERRYWTPGPYPYRYPYYGGASAGGYPYYPYPNGYPAYGGGPRPRLGFGGVQYPPAPISYEYEAQPRAPYAYEASARPGYAYEASARPGYDYETPGRPGYDYETSARPGYDYDGPRRPPAGMLGGYRSASYFE